MKSYLKRVMVPTFCVFCALAVTLEVLAHRGGSGGLPFTTQMAWIMILLIVFCTFAVFAYLEWRPPLGGVPLSSKRREASLR
jgi:hypothetical protein